MPNICAVMTLLSIKKQVLGVLLLRRIYTLSCCCFFLFFDYWRTVTQIKVYYFNRENLHEYIYLYIVNTMMAEEFMVSGNILKVD